MNENRESLRRIIHAMNVIDGIYDMLAKKMNIKTNTLTLLYALDDGKTHIQKEICKEWLIPKTTLNTIIKECVNDGYIILNYHNGHKEKEIYLTDKGRQYTKSIMQQVYDLEERAMAATLKEVSDEFINGFECFTKHLNEEMRLFQNESRKTI